MMTDLDIDIELVENIVCELRKRKTAEVESRFFLSFVADQLEYASAEAQAVLSAGDATWPTRQKGHA